MPLSLDKKSCSLPSLILSASAVSRNIKNSDYEGYGIAGFVEETEEIPFNKNRGFNLNYAELGEAVVVCYHDSTLKMPHI